MGKEMTGVDIVGEGGVRGSIFSHLSSLERIGYVTSRVETPEEALARAAENMLGQMPLPLTFYRITTKGAKNVHEGRS